MLNLILFIPPELGFTDNEESKSSNLQVPIYVKIRLDCFFFFKERIERLQHKNL